VTKPKDEDMAAKKLHDLTGAIRSLELAIASISKGYRFNDDMAEAKIKTMEKSIGIIKRELSPLFLTLADD
jgi:hypothetical protein